MRCAATEPWMSPRTAEGTIAVSGGRAERWTGAFALAIAAAALGYAIQLRNGTYTPEGLIWLSVALVAGVAAVGGVVYRRIEAAGGAAVLAIIGAGLLIQIVPLMTANPGTELWTPLGPFYRMAAVGMAVTGLGLLKVQASRWALPLLLMTHFFMGAWVIRHSPHPLIDVHVVQQAGCEALAHGKNPYAVRPPDIYGPACKWYPPGTVKDGHVTFGCPYPPLSILISMPGYLLAGDFRYAFLVCVTLAAALMGYARGGRLGFAAAALFLLTPRGFFVLQQGWTEPVVVLLLAATVFCACRRPGWTPVMMGLLLASKQYVFIVMPAMLLVSPRPYLGRASWRFWIIAAGVALGVTLPMALWDWGQFANTPLNIRDVFRPDSLSYLAGLASVTGWQGEGWVKFVVLVPLAALVMNRSPRTPAGFAGSAGMLLMMMFAFAPHAAANYYFGCIGALCCAVAASQPDEMSHVGYASQPIKAASSASMFEIT